MKMSTHLHPEPKLRTCGAALPPPLTQFSIRKFDLCREVTGRRGRKRRKLLDDLKERRGYSHLKEEALDRIVWRA